MRALDSKSSIHSAVDLHRFQTKAESIRRNDASNLARDTNSSSTNRFANDFVAFGLRHF